jgi:hypothetical protein
MNYEAAPATKLVATACAVCARPLVDAQSVELGIGPDCRNRYGYDMPVEPEIRKEANRLVNEIACGDLPPAQLREALGQLHALGFDRLAERIEHRVRRQLRTSYTRFTHYEQEEIKTAPLAVIDTPLVAAPAPAPTFEPAPQQLPDIPAITLTAGQEQAVEAVRRTTAKSGAAACFIVGFAGTGKTTTLRVLAKEFGAPIVVTPTGKAALRVKEATGLDARTIHRWIYKPVENPKTGAITFVRRTDDVEVPPSRLVLLDEASMVGPEVWKDVWDTCQMYGLKLVCVGDGFQLPPVQPPNAAPFSILTEDFAMSLNAERAELTEVLRQAAESPIIRASMELRNGGGIRSFRELYRVQTHEFTQVAVATYQTGGVLICHRNNTRFKINASVRAALGITDWQPQPSEPLLILKNTYSVGLVNGESITFDGWHKSPDNPTRVKDNWKHVEEDAHFGGILVGGKSTLPATLAVEELHGRLTTGLGAISTAAGHWARPHQLFLGDTVAPHLHANFGYCYTGHKSQGSQWPYALVVLESSIRLNEDDGRRWAYTSITRAAKATAIYFGNI